MKVIQDEAYRRFLDAIKNPGWKGERIKDVRDRPLTPGGRARMTLFEKAVDEGRAHPRLQVTLPPAQDPKPPAKLYAPAATAPTTAAAFRAHLDSAISAVKAQLAGDDLDIKKAPKGSEKYFKNSIRGQRIARFFDEARADVERLALPPAEKTGARRALREAEDLAYSGDIAFDDADTGTYHSFGKDEPFVHYLEQLLEELPVEEDEAFAALPAEQQESLRRQRRQAQNHLDYLMANKYAKDGIRETDIERSLGGMLVDRDTGRVVSEAPGSEASLVPKYEMLRIDPNARHPQAGAWVYRDGAGGIHLQNGAKVEGVQSNQLRAAPADAARLTFTRPKGSLKPRANVRYDWDGDGHVRAGSVEWVSWAGHCDLKAVEEALGVTLLDDPKLTEHRAESGTAQTFDRKLLLEMLTSILEFGSTYQLADGTGYLERGVHSFGGARNDSLPDRLQLSGTSSGRYFRWPRSRRLESFRVTSIDWGNEKVSTADSDRHFMRYLGDAAAVDFKDNPRYRETVESDYNVIDVTGARLTASIEVDTIDARSGYPASETRDITIDLRPVDASAAPSAADRVFLGAYLEDAAERRLRRVYLDRRQAAIIAELDVYKQQGGKWVAQPVPDETTRQSLARPLKATLSREAKADDPSMFQALLGAALRKGQNINADTDAKAEVWNGVVTRIHAKRAAKNADKPIERWKVDINARFGKATLEYLVKRNDAGEPAVYCPLEGSGNQGPPDFLWQDFPDVGSKGMENNYWVVNQKMMEREVVEVRHEPAVEGEFYVYDDHVKNVMEMLYCALGGYPFTILHQNKRYGFRDQASWKSAVDGIEKLRAQLKFDEE